MDRSLDEFVDAGDGDEATETDDGPADGDEEATAEAGAADSTDETTAADAESADETAPEDARQADETVASAAEPVVDGPVEAESADGPVKSDATEATPADTADTVATDAAVTDSRSAGGESDADESTDGVEPATPTYVSAPSGGECAACGETADRLWRGEPGPVCPDCKEW